MRRPSSRMILSTGRTLSSMQKRNIVDMADDARYVSDSIAKQTGGILFSICTENNQGSARDDAQITPEPDAGGIFLIKGNASFIADVIPPADLPQPGNSGLQGKIGPGGRIIAFQFGRGNRSWSDQAHIAAQDIPELRQLIQAGFSQEPADLRYPRIIFKLLVPLPFRPDPRILRKQFLQTAFRIRQHGSELEAKEFPPRTPNALMPEYHRTFLKYLNDPYQEYQRRAWNHQQQRKDDIKYPLAVTLIERSLIRLALFLKGGSAIIQRHLMSRYFSGYIREHSAFLLMAQEKTVLPTRLVNPGNM